MKRAVMTTNAFNRIIDATKGFCQKCGSRLAHQYIKLEFHSDLDEVVAVAVDGFRLSVEHACCKSDEDFVIFVKGNVKLPRQTDVVIELIEDEAVLKCNGFMFGYKQPNTEFLDWEKVLPKSEPSFKIGFNGEYLLSALQAARVSVGGTYKTPVVLEFRSPLEPVILRTNDKDIKMVLPIRMKD